MKSKSHTKCPICFTANPPHINQYHICSKCDSFYMFPIRSKDYINGYWDAYYPNNNHDYEEVYSYTTLINENKHLFNEKVIEIGSGVGHFLHALKDMNIPYIGLDNNQSAIIYGKLLNSVEIDYMDVEDPFNMIEMAGKIKAKTVCIYNTLEGFRTPVQTMKYIKGFAEKYIHLIISSQSADSLISTNFCMYNEKTIEVLADKIDCNIEKIIKEGDKFEVILRI